MVSEEEKFLLKKYMVSKQVLPCNCFHYGAMMIEESKIKSISIKIWRTRSQNSHTRFVSQIYYIILMNIEKEHVVCFWEFVLLTAVPILTVYLVLFELVCERRLSQIVTRLSSHAWPNNEEWQWTAFEIISCFVFGEFILYMCIWSMLEGKHTTLCLSL